MKRQIDMVRAALDLKINGSVGPGAERKWVNIEAVYPDRAVVNLDGRYWEYPYSLVAGDVAVSDPVEVVETFVPLKEGAPEVTTALRLLEAEGKPAGSVWEATLIQAGVSLNSVFYSDALLREAAPLFEGARIRLLDDQAHVKGKGKDLRDVVGWADAVRFVEGVVPDTGRLVGNLNLHGLPEHTRSLLVGAAQAGRQDIAGLSIDAVGKGVMRLREGKNVKEASRILKVNSVDLIVEPGAGGRLIRLVESAPESTLSQGDRDMQLREKMLRFIEAKAPGAYAKLNPETVSDEELEAAYREASIASVTPSDNSTGDVEERIRMIEARASARAAIGACNLPQPAKDRLQRDFATRERFVEADVTAAIDGERDYLSRFVESGRVRMDDFPDVRVEDRAPRMAAMLDAFFDPAHKDHRNTQSFREAYVEMTGDRRVTGRLQDCDMARLRESAGMNFREATMDSGTFAVALGDAITRRMLAEYNIQNQYDVWRLIANVVPVNDFRTQHRTRWGGFGDLPVVAEGGNYADGPIPGDEESTYKAGKVGRLATVTMEMIRNDDVGMIRQLPIKLARAAKRTLSKFVLDFLAANPAIYDGKALFHVDHANLGVSILDPKGWSDARLAMRSQIEAGSNERLGIPPKFLLVPPELEEMAFDLFKQRGTNNDPSFIQSQAPTIASVWYWDPSVGWVASADKMDIPSIEIGFLDGREEPELFVQDSPTVGSLFASDKITYKVRHVYGGAVTDYRGLYKALEP